MSAAAASKKAAKTAKRPSRSHRPAAASSRGPSKLAQVRLRADELEALEEVMRTLHLDSTSDALREGLRLLAREAAELGAANEIRSFYGDRPAPLPEGAAAPTRSELDEADAMQW